MSKTGLISKSWDREYAAGRYDGEGPSEFARGIPETIRKEMDLGIAKGLYIGCGNGRNYIPLSDAGLRITGIDVSQVAVDKISQKAPRYSSNVMCKSFEDYMPKRLFDFVIAIQVFQHGAQKDIDANFDKVARMIKPGGLFFFSVNSSSTDIYHRHSVIERGHSGSITIQYSEGPKKGLHIHFFSRKEIDDHFRGWEYVEGPHERTTMRSSPEKGRWAQWEAVMRKNWTFKGSI